MNRRSLNYLVIATLAVSVAFTACGGGKSSFDGVYFCQELDFTYTFSGNTYKGEMDGEFFSEGTFEVVEKQKENGVSSGVINIADRYGEGAWQYELDGNRLTLDGYVFIKQGVASSGRANNRGSGVNLSGTYFSNDGRFDASLVVTRNKFKLEINGKVEDEFNYRAVEEFKENNYSRGIVFVTEDGAEIEEKYEIAGNIFTFVDIVFFKKGASAKGEIVMKTEADKITLALSGAGNVTIDWGEGRRQTYEIEDETEIKHQYSSKAARTITITGENIIELDCWNNQLTSLDVSKCISLKTLNCWSNQLTSLDLSKNHALNELDCSDNKLTSLIVSGNGLGWLMLDCSDNQLSASALNALFESLINDSYDKMINIRNNPGRFDCNTSIASNKGWEIRR